MQKASTVQRGHNSRKPKRHTQRCEKQPSNTGHRVTTHASTPPQNPERANTQRRQLCLCIENRSQLGCHLSGCTDLTSLNLQAECFEELSWSLQNIPGLEDLELYAAEGACDVRLLAPLLRQQSGLKSLHCAMCLTSTSLCALVPSGRKSYPS